MRNSLWVTTIIIEGKIEIIAGRGRPKTSVTKQIMKHKKNIKKKQSNSDRYRRKEVYNIIEPT